MNNRKRSNGAMQPRDGMLQQIFKIWDTFAGSFTNTRQKEIEKSKYDWKEPTNERKKWNSRKRLRGMASLYEWNFVVRLVKYSHIISYFGRYLFGDESWCCWCSRHLSHSLGFSHWNAMNLLELKLFACFNAQSLLNVIASISKTFKHIIRESLHNPSRNRNRNSIGSTSRHSNQSMHQLRGLLENAQFICHFSLQLPEEFRHSNIIVPFSPFLFDASLFLHFICSKICFSVHFFLDSLTRYDFFFLRPYNRNGCIFRRILTFCCFEFHPNICAYIIEYLYKYTSFTVFFFSSYNSRSPSNWFSMMLAS